MRNIITILLLLISSVAFGQGTINFGASRSTDTGLTKGQLKFSAYANSNTSKYLTVNSNGYVVFGVPAGGGSAGDSTVFFTVYRADTMRLGIYGKIYSDSVLMRGLITALTNYTDSLYNVMTTKQGADSLLLALQIDTLQLQMSDAIIEISNLQDAVSAFYDSLLAIDSTFVVAFDAIGGLLDTLPYYVPYVGATQNLDLGTHSILAKDGVINHSSGSGTALSVTKGGSGEALTVNKTSGSGNAMSVTGGVTQLSELHTTTAIADAYIASAATWNAKYGTNDTGRAATNIVTGGSLNKVKDSLLAVLSGGGGGGSPSTASAYQVLYQSGTDTVKSTSKLRIDTTDNRLVLEYDSTTSVVATDASGGVKMWGSNRMGMGAVRINDTVSIPSALQRALNAQNTSTIVPYSTLPQTTNAYSYYTAVSNYASSSTLTNNFAAHNATIQRLNYNYSISVTTASANLNAGIYSSSLASAYGLICGNTKFSGGGGRGTFTFCLPTYLATERIFIGYSTVVTASAGVDPSGFTSNPLIAVAKDAADTTFQFMYGSGGGSVTKVDIGIKPNDEDVYRVTVYVAPNSTFYIQLEILSKTGTTTYVHHPTTNVPPVSTKLVSRQLIGNGLSGGVIRFGFINHIEEIY